MRVEDLDPPRVVEGADERIREDLRWLGIDWEEGPDRGGSCAPYTQSERGPIYEAAIELLRARGHVYPCDCSRQEIAQRAPHAGEELVYPGTCREEDPARPMKRPPALRFKAPEEPVSWDDLVVGARALSSASVGDFVLRRGDGLFAYQLAVAVDDWAMNITHVLRGDDLLSSTPRQLALLRALGAPEVPRYGHLPLVRGADGARLAKRTPGAVVRDLRAKGISAREIKDVLADALASARPLVVPARFVTPRW